MGLDSVELIMEVEKHFSISIPDPEAEKAATVGKLVDIVARILRAGPYDFALRIQTFEQIKTAIREVRNMPVNFLITDQVANSINIFDNTLLSALEEKLDLKLPGLNNSGHLRNGVRSKLRQWFSFETSLDFSNLNWKRFIDISLAYNLHRLENRIQYQSRYEIYIAVMRITVDKIGVDYEEIGIEKSFTDDLGVD